VSCLLSIICAFKQVNQHTYKNKHLAFSDISVSPMSTLKIIDGKLETSVFMFIYYGKYIQDKHTRNENRYNEY